LAPIWMRPDDKEDLRVWMSVLHERNSTPLSWALIMLFTALQPHPPTPMTFI